MNTPKGINKLNLKNIIQDLKTIDETKREYETKKNTVADDDNLNANDA